MQDQFIYGKPIDWRSERITWIPFEHFRFTEWDDEDAQAITPHLEASYGDGHYKARLEYLDDSLKALNAKGVDLHVVLSALTRAKQDMLDARRQSKRPNLRRLLDQAAHNRKALESRATSTIAIYRALWASWGPFTASSFDEFAVSPWRSSRNRPRRRTWTSSES